MIKKLFLTNSNRADESRKLPSLLLGPYQVLHAEIVFNFSVVKECLLLGPQYGQGDRGTNACQASSPCTKPHSPPSFPPFLYTSTAMLGRIRSPGLYHLPPRSCFSTTTISAGPRRKRMYRKAGHNANKPVKLAPKDPADRTDLEHQLAGNPYGRCSHALSNILFLCTYSGANPYTMGSQRLT